MRKHIIRRIPFNFIYPFRGTPALLSQARLDVQSVRLNSDENKNFGNQLGGYEFTENRHSGLVSKWRPPFHERAGFWQSTLAALSNKKFAASLTKFNPNNYQYFNFKHWWNDGKKERLVHQQSFHQERLDILGYDLAAAHFTVYRGGAVKFYNQPSWIKDNKESNREYDDRLPNVYESEYVLEAIDLSGTHIMYEGLVNICSLKGLKSLEFTGCLLFDNFCLDRISGEYGEILEHLDISYTNITHHGLSALYRFSKLKTLKIEGIRQTPELVQFCSELKINFPDLDIQGGCLEQLTENPDLLKDKNTAVAQNTI